MALFSEPDQQCRPVLGAALASLYWSVVTTDSLSEVATHLPGPWAMILAVESGRHRRDRKRSATCASSPPSTAICVLVDEASPEL